MYHVDYFSAPRRSNFDPGPVHVGFLVDRVTLGQVFISLFQLFRVNIIPSLVHTQLHLCATLIIRTKGQSLVVFKKQCYFGNWLSVARKVFAIFHGRRVKFLRLCVQALHKLPPIFIAYCYCVNDVSMNGHILHKWMLCHATACFRNIAWTMFPVSTSMPSAHLRRTSAVLGQGIILASKACPLGPISARNIHPYYLRLCLIRERVSIGHVLTFRMNAQDVALRA